MAELDHPSLPKKRERYVRETRGKLRRKASETGETVEKRERTRGKRKGGAMEARGRHAGNASEEDAKET